MPRKTTIIPSASRLMSSLRDIGYDLASAVADLVDNSIDAGATTVQITVCRRGGNSFIRIADDGCGMTERVVGEAMRYGSRRAYRSNDLGRFGLGLKTASLSQCRRLTVATRTTAKGPVRIRRWDLDHVRSTDAWELERLTAREAPAYLVEPLAGPSGTVVLWEKLDRVLAYARPDGEHALRALEDAAETIAEHLSMVFHRFLSGEAAGAQRLRILFNGDALRPWDPYARSERATERLATQQVPLEAGGEVHVVRVQPYILPSQIQFSSVAAHADAAGPRLWNRQQGLYIYRGDRLIQSGGWNRLRTMDEHSKLARIAVDIPSALENAFQINVAKMRVVIPDDLRPQLRALAAGVVTRAQDRYRRRLSLVPTPKDGGYAVGREPEPSWTLGDLWPVIADVLRRELATHPDVLDRVLLALANARPPVATAAYGKDEPATAR